MELLKNKIFISFVALLLTGISGVFYFKVNEPRTLEITAQTKSEEEVLNKRHPLTGQRCENSAARPYAVMLAGDTVTRPLSGISKADLVIEMPVVKDSITRFMAFYACEQPEEIGSVRSARDDFIPLAAGFDAIYAHWGGSSFALKDLNRGVIDNLDALINPNNVYFRKNTTYPPHNGFTSYSRMAETSSILGYRAEINFEGYPVLEEVPEAPETIPSTISIGYPYPFDASYIYSRENNEYLRWRGSKPEVDALDGTHVALKVLIVIKTNTRQINADYNDVDVTGEDEALIFQNGGIQKVTWQKDTSQLDSKLKFLDDGGNEVPLVAGNIWIHIIDTYTTVKWGEENL